MPTVRIASSLSRTIFLYSFSVRIIKVGTDELLQDNLDAATLLHATELSERLKALSPEGQRKVMNVLDTLIDELR